MAHGIVWGLAAVLWPLLAVFVWWAVHLPRRERRRTLLILGAGALTGVSLILLFGFPTLLRGESLVSPPLFSYVRDRWVQFAVAAPLGALIAFFLTEFLNDNQNGHGDLR